MHDAYLEVGDRDVQEHLALGNKVTNNLDSVPMNTADGSVVPVTSGTHAKFKQRLSTSASSFSSLVAPTHAREERLLHVTFFLSLVLRVLGDYGRGQRPKN